MAGSNLLQPAANDLLCLPLQLGVRHPARRQLHQPIPIGLELNSSSTLMTP